MTFYVVIPGDATLPDPAFSPLGGLTPTDLREVGQTLVDLDDASEAFMDHVRC